MALKQFLIAVDQLFNTIAGGYADETLSARAWRYSLNNNNFAMNVIDFIFGKGHCRDSYIAELERKQLPKEYR